LSVFSVIAMGANHILYDPYSRQIMASVGSGSPSIAANSIAAIQPYTVSVGTPVPIGGTPTSLALSSDGQILYAMLPAATAGSIARFNMLTQQPDFTFSPFPGDSTSIYDIAAQPGTENTVAVDGGPVTGIALFDIDPTAKTATMRGAATGIYTGTCLAFPNASALYSLELGESPTAINVYSVAATGLVSESSYYQNTSVIQNLNCYKLSGDLLVTQSGGAANTSTIPLTQAGVFQGAQVASTSPSGIRDFAPDTSLGLAYFLTDVGPNDYSAIFDSLTTFSTQTFMPVSVLALPFETFEGAPGFTGVDVVRWGQDGLAILTSGGNVYLVRGAAIVPQLLQVGPAASLTASSLSSIVHGSGNTLLTLTGANFLPGVAVSWNGSYRTTTVVDPSHVTVAIPASDLANPGTVTVIATNPGATPSNSLTVNVD
jgi:hypothetical protein